MNMRFQNIAKLKIGIIGSAGFLGSNLFEYFKNAGFEVVGITRENDEHFKGARFDVLINANGNSRRFWANQNPLLDFEASVLSVERSIFNFPAEKYVLISSSDVYPKHHRINQTKETEKIDEQKLCPYGFNKYLAEKIVSRYCKDYLILRCSAMLGENLKKGPLRDILDSKPLFIKLNSKIQFILAKEIAKIIETLIKKNIKNQIFNAGGAGAVDFRKLSAIFKKDIKVQTDAETQRYEMSVQKLNKIFPLKSSEEYLRKFLKMIELL